MRFVLVAVLCFMLIAAFLTASATATTYTFYTLGKTDIGGSSGGFGTGYVVGSRWTTSTTLNVTGISAALKSIGGSAWHVNLAIYNASDNSLVASTGSQTVTLTSSYAWYNFTLPCALSPGDYWLAGFGDDADIINCAYSSTANSSDGMYDAGNTFPTLPNPLVPTGLSRIYSIYITYSVASDVDAWDNDLNNYFCAAMLLVMGFVFMIFMVSRRRS